MQAICQCFSASRGESVTAGQLIVQKSSECSSGVLEKLRGGFIKRQPFGLDAKTQMRHGTAGFQNTDSGKGEMLSIADGEGNRQSEYNIGTVFKRHACPAVRSEQSRCASLGKMHAYDADHTGGAALPPRFGQVMGVPQMERIVFGDHTANRICHPRREAG